MFLHLRVSSSLSILVCLYIVHVLLWFLLLHFHRDCFGVLSSSLVFRGGVVLFVSIRYVHTYILYIQELSVPTAPRKKKQCIISTFYYRFSSDLMQDHDLVLRL